MKKINKLFSVLFMMLLAFLLLTGNSYALCDEDAIEKDITKMVDTVVPQLRRSLEEYNRATKTFEDQCGEILDNHRDAMLSFDVRTLQQALSFNKEKYAYLTDMSQYEDTGIKWGEVPADNEQCENLRIDAWEKLDHYTGLYTKAVVVFGVAGGSQLPVSCICPEGSNERVCTAYTDAKITEQKIAGKCDTFATYLSSLYSCPLCPIFQTVLNTDAKIANISWRALSKALQRLVMIAFLIYLALETLKIVSNIAGSSMSSYLKSIFILGFKVTLTYFLLSNSSYIYGYFISPVLQAALDMGTSLISVSSSQASVCLANNANVDFVSTPGGVLDAQLLDSIMRTVRCFGHTATIMPAIGRGLICHGWASGPDFQMWFSGVLFYIFGLGIWLVISFYLIDCTVQLGMLCAILPFLVACWPFKLTQKYAIKGAQLLMNTFFNYLMLGIVLLLGVEIINFATGKKSGTITQFMDAMNNNSITQLREMTSLDGISILVLIICCIFAFKLIAKTNELADKFSKGSGMDIASKLGGLASSAVVGAVAAGGNVGLKVGEAALEETGILNALGDAKEGAKDFMLGTASDFGKRLGLESYQVPNQPAQSENGADTGNNGGNNGGAGGGSNNGGNNDTGGSSNGGNNDTPSNDANGGSNDGGNPQNI